MPTPIISTTTPKKQNNNSIKINSNSNSPASTSSSSVSTTVKKASSTAVYNNNNNNFNQHHIHITPTTSPSTATKFPPLTALEQDHQQQQQQQQEFVSSSSSSVFKNNNLNPVIMSREGSDSNSNTKNGTSYAQVAFSFDSAKLESISASPVHFSTNRRTTTKTTTTTTKKQEEQEQVAATTIKNTTTTIAASQDDLCCSKQEDKINNNQKRHLDVDPLSGTIKVGCTSLLTPTSVEVVSSQNSGSNSRSTSADFQQQQNHHHHHSTGSRRSSCEIRINDQEQTVFNQNNNSNLHHLHQHQFVVSTPPTTTGNCQLPQFPGVQINNNNNSSSSSSSSSENNNKKKQPSPTLSPRVVVAEIDTAPPLRKVTYSDIHTNVNAVIVDQCLIENIRTAPATEFTYRSEHQRGNVVLGTARTFSGQVFTVQRLMVGQLERGFLHQLGFHALGRLLSFCSGDDVLLFGYPMECPKRVEKQAPAMLGIWLPVDGLNVRLVDLQRMRVMFAQEGILCATEPEDQRRLLEEVERRRQQHSILSPNTQQREETAAIWSNDHFANINNQNGNGATVISNAPASLLGLPESPVSLEPARSPPGGSESINVQLPVILYRPPQPHPIPAMNLGAANGVRAFRPFQDTTHRKNNNQNQNQNNNNNFLRATNNNYQQQHQHMNMNMMMQGNFNNHNHQAQQQFYFQQQQPQRYGGGGGNYNNNNQQRYQNQNLLMSMPPLPPPQQQQQQSNYYYQQAQAMQNYQNFHQQQVGTIGAPMMN